MELWAVTEPSSHNRMFRFGLYELDGSTGELRKDGKSRPRLLGQPLEVLLHLLERPGDVVTREELRQRLWPADTFVDYDHSLNTAINKVREALGDSADNPRFIQTIPRRGYRFIAGVNSASVNAGSADSPSVDSATQAPPLTEAQAPVIESNRQANGASLPAVTPATGPEKRMALLSDPDELPPVPGGVVRLLFSLIQVMYLCFYVASLASVQKMDAMLGQMLQYPNWLFVLLLVTALVGIPVRLYLLSGAVFGYSGLTRRFLSLFPGLFPLDEFWALAPFLLVNRIGVGLALAATAALLYVPFAQRSLLLMGDHDSNKQSQSGKP